MIAPDSSVSADVGDIAAAGTDVVVAGDFARYLASDSTIAEALIDFQ